MLGLLPAAGSLGCALGEDAGGRPLLRGHRDIKHT